MPTTEPNPPGGHWPALDGVRGVAVLGVVCFHTGAVPFGWLGVPVFFVLSGHFITRILVRRRTSLRDFARNRVLRLAPLYVLVCLALSVLALAGAGPGNLPGDLPYLWTWTYNLRPLTGGWVDNDLYDHLWSLAVEVQLYVVWAALAVLLTRRWFVRVVVALAVGGPLVRVAVWLVLARCGCPHGALPGIGYQLPTTYLDAFAIGALTALPEVRARLWPARRLVLLTGAAVLLVALGQIGLSVSRGRPFPTDLGYPITFPYHLGWVWQYSLAALFAGALVLAAAGGGRASRVLATPVLARVGLWSYGVYVLHRPLAEAAERAAVGWPVLAVATVGVAAASVGLAAASYRFVELPFIARKRNALVSVPKAQTS